MTFQLTDCAGLYPGVIFYEGTGALQKPMTLGHSHASMAATLAYRVFKGCPLRCGGGEQRSANQGEASPFWILSRSALQDDISSFLLFIIYLNWFGRVEK